MANDEYSFLKIRYVPAPQPAEEQNPHLRFPAVMDCGTEFEKGRMLVTPFYVDLHEVPDDEVQKMVARVVQQIESDEGGDENEDEDEGDGDISWGTIEQYGTLCYRLLCRIKDLHRAYTRVPKFFGNIPIQGDNPFIVALAQVALRRRHIQVLKNRIWYACKEWHRHLTKMQDCELFLKDFQSAAEEGGPRRFNDAYDLAWRQNAVATYFIPKTMASESHDRCYKMRVNEKRVMESLNVACDKLMDAEPEPDSVAWLSCLHTVEDFYTMEGQETSVATQTMLGRVM